MKIVIAPDSFKESLSAMQVANAIETGFKQVLPNAQYIKVPVADGGEGTVQSVVDATGGKIITVSVQGPLGDTVNAFYGVMGQGKTAIIEMAAASGLHLVDPSRRNPLLTSSWGTGQLIAHALDHGIRHIIIGLGGSATNDAGAGMAMALGAILLDEHKQPLALGGEALADLAYLDTSKLHPAIAECQFDVACDVDNPLCGARGASSIFGPQKGATPYMVKQLDAALNHYADILVENGYVDHRLTSGSGAAGGMGLSVMSLLEATLRPGIEIVLETLKFDEQITGADLVITGEGRLDSQTLHGKTPIGVTRAAQRHNIPVIAIAGCVSHDANQLLAHGITAVFAVVPRAMPLNEALAESEYNLTQAAINIARLWQLK
ncbi:glycerate kinase [Shewanella marina]|uniref:glycerate kinase n=1 Tax=Shewanella marina TaxID=487319 RepID=UPI0004718F1E|nr:glycerate kinase [Shewanella marina]